MEQPKQINPEHIINSLASQISNVSIQSAQKDAVIVELNQQIEDLQSDVKNLQEELQKNAKK